MTEAAKLLLELGGIILLLAMLGRMAGRIGLSPIPLYLLGGLTFGEGGLVPLITSEPFVSAGAQLGVVLLLLMLGLEYTGTELVASLRSNMRIGMVGFLSTVVPGTIVGLILGLGPLYAVFLGIIVYNTSSAVAAKLLNDLGWVGNRETPTVLSILVFEDLVMAVVLPILGAVALGGSPLSATLSMTAGLSIVAVILYIATRHGERVGRMVFSNSPEVNLLTLLGLALVVAGLAEGAGISAAVGAFLVGLAVSGEGATEARKMLVPLRDLFAAVFFVFFGLITDPSVLPDVVMPVLILAVLTGAAKYWLGSWAARLAGIGVRGQRRAGSVVIARGEFSIIVAGIGVAAGAPPDLAAIAAGYVLVMATVGPLAALLADRRPSGPQASDGSTSATGRLRRLSPRRPDSR